MSVSRIQPFNPSTDNVESWTSVLQNFLLASGVDKNNAADQPKATAIFLSSVGVSNYTLIRDLVSPSTPESKKIDDLITVLVNHYQPKPKAISERYKFYNRKQQPGESVTVFLSELRKLAVTCKFEKLDISLRDQFVVGLSSEAAQKRLFLEDDTLPLDNAVAIGISQEAAEASTRLIRQNSQVVTPESTNKINVKRQSNKFQKSSSQKQKSPHQSSQDSPCTRCGNSVHFKECPALKVTCKQCGKVGHFAKFCFNKSTSQEGKGSPSSSVKVVRIAQREEPIVVTVKLNNVKVNMELDTGSGRSFISTSAWENLGSPPLEKCNVCFSTYTGEQFQATGQFQCAISHNGQSRQHIMLVTNSSSLFGRDLLNKFQMDWVTIKKQCSQVNKVNCLPTLESVLEEYKDIFQSSEHAQTIKNFKAKLTLKEDATPKFFKARPVPFSVRDKVDKELEKMEKSGVLTKLEHSEWASPIVVVPKSNGRVRITGDFKRTINSQLCVNQYPLARVDDLLETISGGSSFSKLDGSDAFHQVMVEESCRKFLVINTHRGLYQYNVLPQGIASSPAIFQELMDNMLRGINMTGSFVDDAITSGKSDGEHLLHLQSIFQRMRAANYRLSRSKCEFMQPSVKFLGSIVCSEGIRPDPEKINAILSIKEPENVTEVKSFLGLVNFYGKFIPNLSSVCEPMYSLTRKEVEWNWSKSCKSAFREVKRQVSNSSLLVHYSQSIPVGISCDASSVGLGVVLFHRYPDGAEKPIAYASKTLSSAEKNYSQIEKEGLSIVFGLKKFLKYLYGRKFILVTDHKPLLAIFGSKRDVPSLAATRLNHWSLLLSGFCYDIEYRNTHSHGNADALSRLPLPENEEVEPAESFQVKRIVEENPLTSKKVRLVTSRDPVTSKLCQYIQSGWPEKQNAIPVEIRPYFSHRHEYTVEQGIVMWGFRVVVPASLREAVLKQLHDSHPGIVRMKSIARQFVWWPGIDSDIESVAKSCHSCAIHKDNPTAAPLHPWSFPEKPWQRLHLDLAGPFHNNMWLVMVDAYSKWPEVIQLGKDTTSSKIICHVREVIARFGLPDTIVTDNGPQFVSEEFQSFLQNNGIRHARSSVYHPRSNGEAERFVRTFKNAIYGRENQSNLNLSLCDFLLTYRITPHATTGTSPSELMLKRKPKTLFDLLRPDHNSTARQSQEKQVEQQKPSKLRQFVINQSVWFKSFSKNSPTWSLGTVEKVIGPLTYIVKAEGRTYKRHVDHILDGEVIRNQPSPDLDLDEDQEEEGFAIPVSSQPEEVVRRYPIRQRRAPNFYRH